MLPPQNANLLKFWKKLSLKSLISFFCSFLLKFDHSEINEKNVQELQMRNIFDIIIFEVFFNNNKTEAGVMFDNSFFDNSFVLV
jgi:hypothetical protein